MNFYFDTPICYLLCLSKLILKLSISCRVVLTIRKLEKEILAMKGHVMILATRSGDMNNTHMNGLNHKNRKVVFLNNSFPIPFLEDPKNPHISYHFPYSLSSSTKKEILDFCPTVIHNTSPDFTGLCLVSFARKHQIPLMTTYHSNFIDYMDHYPGMRFVKPFIKGWFLHYYSFFQSVYVPTPFIINQLKKNLDLHQNVDLKVWGRGIDLDKFSPTCRSEEFRQKYGIAPSEVVILFVGRLVPEKRLDIFAEVVQRLTKQGLPFKALVVGLGTEMYENLPNTTYCGWMSGSDLSVAYASSDIFLFPSATETFGNVTLEAAASGLPLVVEEKCSGHLVNHGQNGFACAEGDTDAFFNATLALVEDSKKRKRFSEKSREHSLNFELHTVNNQMIKNYQHTVDEFESKYGKDHRMRDMEWKSTGFPGGDIARPITVALVEIFVILVLRGIFAIGTSIMTISNKMKGNPILPTQSSTNNGSKEQPTSEQRPYMVNWAISVGNSRALHTLSQLFISTVLLFLKLSSIVERKICNQSRRTKKL